MQYIAKPLFDNRNFAFQLSIDDGFVVGVQRAHVNAADEGDLTAVFSVNALSIHTSFDFNDLQRINARLNHMRQQRFDKTA